MGQIAVALNLLRSLQQRRSLLDVPLELLLVASILGLSFVKQTS